MATLKQNSEALKAITNKLKNLPKRAVLTDLVVTKNGDYTPEDENSGFKRVTVEVPSDLDARIDGTVTEVSSGVTKVSEYAFYNCTTLTSVNFPNATSIGTNAFNGCSKLTSTNFPNVTTVGSYTFQYCKALQSVDFPKATLNGTYTFYGCTSLTSVNFPNSTKIGMYSFQDCRVLKSVNFPKATDITPGSFQACQKLENVVFQSAITVGNSAFQECKALEKADMPKATNIGNSVFSNCYLLKAVILRSETLCKLSATSSFNNCYHILGTVNSTYNPNGDKDGYFYVPRALLSDTDETMDYRRATNWSTYASQFRALEDYTVDGTITGELDPIKI